MNAQVEEIYRDVLKEGYKIAILKQDENKYHVVTYYPYPGMLEVMKHGYDLRTMIEFTDARHYILQDE